MKQALLKRFKYAILLIMIFICNPVFAYQTVLIEFPEGEVWHCVYKRTINNERIVQLVPIGETFDVWNRTIIFHAYRGAVNVNATRFLSAQTAKLEKVNDTQRYIRVKNSTADAISTRCITTNTTMKSQCDIIRAIQGPEGIVSIQYINKLPESFKTNYNTWYNVINGAKMYYSYFRMDRIMGKAVQFEL